MVYGKTLAIGIPITTIVIAIFYFCTNSYTDHNKLIILEPALNLHILANASSSAEILTELKNIDKRLIRIESKIDSERSVSISSMISQSAEIKRF